jgi:DNA primase
MSGEQFVDPMDAVIERLQPRDTRADQQPNPEEFKQTQEPIQQQPVQSESQPQQPEQQPQPVVEPVNNQTEPYNLDKEIDDLLELVKKTPETKQEIKDDVNVKPDKKSVKVPKILERDDNQQLSVDEKEEITNYIYDLEDQLANLEFDKKRESVEKGQLEQMLEKERAKNNEVFDKLKELEREMKKSKSVQLPDELQTLIDYYKLNKDNNTLYNKRNLV